MKSRPYVNARTCVYNLNYHIVWCVKYRRKVLTQQISDYLINDINSIAKEKGFTVIETKVGDGDHIHVFVSVPPKFSITTIVSYLKGITGRHLHKVQLLHEHIANQRKNFCHAVSAAIAKQYDAVFVEDINLRGLAGSLKLGKSTNDNGFGMFRTMLEYKLTSQGKTFAKIDKWYPSSKTCSVCGFVKDDLTLADRVWTCSACNTTHNRDHNAAINIRNVGLLGLYPA